MDALRIGEVARRTGLTVRTLRHYDDLGLLVPSARSSGDYRLYSDADLRRLLAIQHLKSLGLGLDEVARALDDPSFDAASALADHVAAVEQRLAAERELLRRLRRVQRSADWAAVVDAIALSEALRHPDAHVRLRATLDAPTAAPAETLVEHLVSDPNAGVREVLTWALAHHGDDATSALVGRLREREPAVRLQVVHALGKLGDPAAAPPVAPLLFDHDPAVAAKAAFVLGRLGGDVARDALLSAVGTADPSVREAVSDALMGWPEALDPLADLLADPHAAVREHAAEVLGFLGDPAAVGPLAAAVGDRDAGVRFAALLALGHLGGEGARAAIATATASSVPRERLVAGRLLADLT